MSRLCLKVTACGANQTGYRHFCQLSTIKPWSLYEFSVLLLNINSLELVMTWSVIRCRPWILSSVCYYSYICVPSSDTRRTHRSMQCTCTHVSNHRLVLDNPCRYMIIIINHLFGAGHRFNYNIGAPYISSFFGCLPSIPYHLFVTLLQGTCDRSG